jgi:hypothetical protein
MGEAGIGHGRIWEGKRPRQSCDEQWLEHMVRGLYRAVLDEPLPEALLDTLGKLSQPEPRIAEATARARSWRAKAEEIRTAAESLGSDGARRSLLQLAHDYEALAERAEKEARQRDHQARDAG